MWIGDFSNSLPILVSDLRDFEGSLLCQSWWDLNKNCKNLVIKGLLITLQVSFMDFFRPWTQYKHKSTIAELCNKFTYKNTFNFIVIFLCHFNHVVLWPSIRRSKKTNFKDLDGTHADNLCLHLHEYWPIVPWDPWVVYLVHVWMSIKIAYYSYSGHVSVLLRYLLECFLKDTGCRVFCKIHSIKKAIPYVLKSFQYFQQKSIWIVNWQMT